MVHPVKTLRTSKFRRDLAEILQRTCREPSKNPPRTRRMNPKQSCLSQCDFFKRTSFADKPFDKIAENKKWGGGLPPWGSSIE